MLLLLRTVVEGHLRLGWTWHRSPAELPLPQTLSSSAPLLSGYPTLLVSQVCHEGGGGGQVLVTGSILST